MNKYPLQIVVRHYPDRKKPCLVLEQGCQGVILATFKNSEMERLYTEVLGGKNVIQILGEWTLEDFLREVGYE